MKKILFLSCLILLTACSEAPTTIDDEKAINDEPTADEITSDEVIKSEKSMLDYMTEIHEAGLLFPEDSTQELIDAVEILDEKNYYVSLRPLWLDGGAAFTIFVEPDGGQLYALETRGCGPFCEQDLNFYRLKNNKFVDVTKEVLPEINFDSVKKKYPEDFSPLYILPQKSTTISVIEQYSQEEIFQIKWVKGKFVVKEVY